MWNLVSHIKGITQVEGEISGPHSGKYEDYSFVGYKTM
jgi:hypothetical protein